MRWIVLFSLLLLSKCLILAFGNISIQNSSIYKKSNCGKTLNSMYYATCRQRVCGQNKDNLCLHAARTLIWRSCAFNRGSMTMPVLDGPMTMPILDGVKPMEITLPICGTSESLFWKRKKKHILLDSVETNLNIWRVRWPSPRQVRVQIPTSPRQVRDDRKTSRVRTRVRDRTRVLQPFSIGVRAHSTWSVAFSYALVHGASLANICRVTG